jgi:hypothetical protein
VASPSVVHGDDRALDARERRRDRIGEVGRERSDPALSRKKAAEQRDTLDRLYSVHAPLLERATNNAAESTGSTTNAVRVASPFSVCSTTTLPGFCWIPVQNFAKVL